MPWPRTRKILWQYFLWQKLQKKANRAHPWPVYIPVCLYVCLFTSPARGGGRHLRESGANPGQRDQLLLVHEPQGETGGQGELVQFYNAHTTLESEIVIGWKVLSYNKCSREV